MKTLFTILFSVLSALSFAQIVTVIDENAHPISFVTVSDLRTQAGGYTDELGIFHMDSIATLPDDVIVLSHIGYKEIRMTASQLASLQFPIQLVPLQYSLREVEVNPTDAKSLLMDALARIRDNYPTDFSKNHVVYKSTMNFNGMDMYFYYFDCDMYMRSYMVADSGAIYDSDIKHVLFNHDGQLHPASVRTPMKFITHMYPEKIFDPKELLKDGFTVLSTSAVIDSEEYDVVSFFHKPPAMARSVRMEVTAYINKKDKGIRFINEHVYSDHPGRIFLLGKVDTLNAIEQISYKKVDGKYVLDYISSSVFGQGKAFSAPVKITQSTTLQVVSNQQKLKSNEIVIKKDIEDIIQKETPQNIQAQKGVLPEVK